MYFLLKRVAEFFNPKFWKEEDMGTPVVFIHGIKGSHLAQTYDDSFDTICSGVQKSFETIWDLTLDESGEVDASPYDMIEAMQVEVVAYGELLGRLRSKLPGTPIYIYRYDWRLDNRRNAERLGGYLAILQKKTNAGCFRFITHSMGGLILSAFLNLDRRNHALIERALIAVPPFWGSCESVRALVVGDARRWLIGSSEAFRKIARTFPSVYQLVPGYDNALNPSRDIWDYGNWQHRIEFGSRNQNDYDKRDNLMERHLGRAKEFHATGLFNFDNGAWPQTERNKYLVLYGTGEKTLQSIEVRPKNSAKDIENFFDFDKSTYSQDGDGTVPARSALRYKTLKTHEIKLNEQSSWWLPTTYDDKAKVTLAGFHGAFLAMDKVQGVVLDWLTNATPYSDKIMP
jgi:pimeloyl-ACP methyl ester carboxylesterase